MRVTPSHAPRAGKARRRGFTRTDLLVSLAVAAVVMAIGGVRLHVTREKAGLARCTANLEQVSRAVLSYAADNDQTLPGAEVTDTGSPWWWYKEKVKRYVGVTGSASAADAVFACPNDRGYSDPIPFHANPRFDYGSYVFNGITLPGIPNISGFRVNAIRQPVRTLLVMEWCAHAPLSWHHSRTGLRNTPFYCDAESVVAHVDGHVSFSRMYYDGYNAAYTQDPIPGYDYQYSGD